jgi:hypothetical protein|nr:MAG TPA: LONG TAIL FIBER PROTEIN [Caudoviricetes sp.]
MDFVLTTAGLQALINASETGTNAVVLSHIGIGSGKYTPSKAQTAMQSLIKKLAIIEAGQAGDNAIHVAARDSDAVTYEAFEVGIFTSTGTLFAVTSQTTPIIQKTAAATALLAFDLKIVGAEARGVSFGNVSYSFTAGTTSRPGIVELATSAEVIAGTDTQRVVTPAGLQTRTATDARTGLVELATDAEVKTGTDKARAVTPAGLKAALLSTYKATSTLVDAGTNDSTFVTPKSLRALEANVSRAGLICIATESDIASGTSTSLAVTPKQLHDALETAVPAASEAAAGAIRIASSTEATDGVNAESAMTPETTKKVLDARACTLREAQVGTENSKFVTPQVLASMRATNAQAIAGTLTNVFITPAGLKAAIDAAVKKAISEAKEEGV